MRLASRVPGRGPKSPARTTHPQRESHSSLSLSLSPQHPPLVFEASENTMTRPPKSPPSVETGPPSSRAPPKRHPREKASRPLPSTSAFGQRDKKRARETGSVRVSTTRGPGEKTSLATRPPPDPLSSSPTHRTNTTLSHSLTLSLPYRRSPLDDDPTGTPFVRHPESFVQSIPTLSQMWPEPRGWAAIYVQDIDAPCVLRFAWIHALCCALHRSTSRVIHRPRS